MSLILFNPVSWENDSTNSFYSILHFDGKWAKGVQVYKCTLYTKYAVHAGGFWVGASLNLFSNVWMHISWAPHIRWMHIVHDCIVSSSEINEFKGVFLFFFFLEWDRMRRENWKYQFRECEKTVRRETENEERGQQKERI